jgi:hypothetical protein
MRKRRRGAPLALTPSAVSTHDMATSPLAKRKE